VGEDAGYVVRCKCDPSPDGTGGDTVVDHVRLFRRWPNRKRAGEPVSRKGVQTRPWVPGVAARRASSPAHGFRAVGNFDANRNHSPSHSFQVFDPSQSITTVGVHSEDA
jgi:hypothetical protein